MEVYRKSRVLLKIYDFLILGTFLAFIVPGVKAAGDEQDEFGFGDFIALTIIVVLMVGGIFACLGQYARSQAGR